MRWCLVTAASWPNSSAVGVKMTVGLRWTGSFLTASRSRATKEPCLEVGGAPSGFPVFVEFYDDLSVEHAVDVGLAGNRDFFRAFGGIEGDFEVEEVDAAIED